MPVLLVHGRVTVTGVKGIVPEYALAQRHYYGEEQATLSLAEAGVPDTRMARSIHHGRRSSTSRHGSPAGAPRTSRRENADGHLCPDPRRR